MPQLHVRLTEEQMVGLRKIALNRRTTVSWLIRDYAEYLSAGGQPLGPGQTPDGEDPALETAYMAHYGGAFDWLADEPDLYTLEDAEAV